MPRSRASLAGMCSAWTICARSNCPSSKKSSPREPSNCCSKSRPNTRKSCAPRPRSSKWSSAGACRKRARPDGRPVRPAHVRSDDRGRQRSGRRVAGPTVPRPSGLGACSRALVDGPGCGSCDKRTRKKALRQTRRKAFRRWSERRDSNSRPPAPQADALPGCATLRWPPFYTLICQAPAFWRTVRLVIFHGDSDSAGTRLQPPIGAISMGSGALGWWLGLRYEMPVITAWSTPGAALLIGSLPEPGSLVHIWGRHHGSIAWHHRRIRRLHQKNSTGHQCGSAGWSAAQFWLGSVGRRLDAWRTLSTFIIVHTGACTMKSSLRLPYYELSPQLLQGLRQIKVDLEASPLGLPLIELVYLRVAQINGCSYCLNMHTKTLRERNETDRRLAELAGWRVSSQFSQREKSALEWAESLTHVADTHAPDEAFFPLKEHFSDQEISDLTFAIALMNAMTRLAIGMRQ